MVKYKSLRIFCCFVLLFLSSCSSEPDVEPRCIAADDFGQQDIFISAYKAKGSADFKDAGGNTSDMFNDKQVIRWEDTGLLTDGSTVILKTTGGWTSWGNNGNVAVSAYKKNENLGIPFVGGSPPADVYLSNVDRERICGPFPTKIVGGSGCNSECEFIDVNMPEDDPAAGIYGAPCWFENGYSLYLLFRHPDDPDPNGTLSLMRSPESPTLHVGYKSIYEGGTDVFSADNIPDGSCGEVRIEPGWKIYAKIVDRFYWDNAGGYTVHFLGGVYDSGASHIFDKLRNIVRSRLEAATVEIFTLIISNASYLYYIRLCLVLFIMITAMGYILRIIQPSEKDMFVRIIKIAFVASFTYIGIWDFLYDHLFKLFFEGVDVIIAMINSHSGVIYNPTHPFAFIDHTLGILFSANTYHRLIALMMSSKCIIDGLIAAIIIFLAIIVYIVMLTYAFIVYLAALIGISIAFIIMPIIVLGIFFPKLSDLFSNSIKILMSFSLQAILIFTLVGMFSSIIMNTYYRTLGFTMCYNPIFTIPILWKKTHYNWTAGQKFELWGKYTFTGGQAIIAVPPLYEKTDFRYRDLPFYDPDSSSQDVSHMKQVSASHQDAFIALNGAYRSVDELASPYVTLRYLDTFIQDISQASDTSLNTVLLNISLEARDMLYNKVVGSQEGVKSLLSLGIEMIKHAGVDLSNESPVLYDFIDGSIASYNTDSSKADSRDLFSYLYSEKEAEYLSFLSLVQNDPLADTQAKEEAALLSSSITNKSLYDSPSIITDFYAFMEHIDHDPVLRSTYSSSVDAILASLQEMEVSIFNMAMVDSKIDSGKLISFPNYVDKLKSFVVLKDYGYNEGASTDSVDLGYDHDILEEILGGRIIPWKDLGMLLLITVFFWHLRLMVQKIGASIAGGSPFLNVIGMKIANMFAMSEGPKSIFARIPGAKYLELPTNLRAMFSVKMHSAITGIRDGATDYIMRPMVQAALYTPPQVVDKLANGPILSRTFAVGSAVLSGALDMTGSAFTAVKWGMGAQTIGEEYRYEKENVLNKNLDYVKATIGLHSGYVLNTVSTGGLNIVKNYAAYQMTSADLGLTNFTQHTKYLYSMETKKIHDYIKGRDFDVFNINMNNEGSLGEDSTFDRNDLDDGVDRSSIEDDNDNMQTDFYDDSASSTDADSDISPEVENNSARGANDGSDVSPHNYREDLEVDSDNEENMNNNNWEDLEVDSDAKVEDTKTDVQDKMDRDNEGFFDAEERADPIPSDIEDGSRRGSESSVIGADPFATEEAHSNAQNADSDSSEIYNDNPQVDYYNTVSGINMRDFDDVIDNEENMNNNNWEDLEVDSDAKVEDTKTDVQDKMDRDNEGFFDAEERADPIPSDIEDGSRRGSESSVIGADPFATEEAHSNAQNADSDSSEIYNDNPQVDYYNTVSGINMRDFDDVIDNEENMNNNNWEDLELDSDAKVEDTKTDVLDKMDRDNEGFVDAEENDDETTELFHNNRKTTQHTDEGLGSVNAMQGKKKGAAYKVRKLLRYIGSLLSKNQ